MGGACRLGDKAKVPLDVHGCPACPHPDLEGPSVTASGNVLINGAPALRTGDMGVHTACCSTNIWVIIEGSGQVVINGMAMVRKGDQTQHCGGIGKMIEASGNVVDGSSAGIKIRTKNDGTDMAAGPPGLLDGIEVPIGEWLDMVRDDGIAALLYMRWAGAGMAFFAKGEVNKLFDPDCRGASYFEHLAKCLPGKPPGDHGKGPRGPMGPPSPAPARRRPFTPDPGAEPVGFFDLDNPITGAALLAGGGVAAGVVRGGEVVVGGVRAGGGAAVRGAVSGGKWVVNGAGDALGGAGRLIGGGAHAFGF